MIKDKSTSTPASGTQKSSPAMFGMQNYILFGVGVLLLFIGFVMMSGGASKDPNVFNKEVFNSSRITVAPILVLMGFAVTVVGIMRRSKN